MKLPRWLVIGMLTSCVLAVLAAGGWWWVTWPERTAREFASLVADGQFDKANDLLVPPTCWTQGDDNRIALDQPAEHWVSSREIWQMLFRERLHIAPRTISDVALGRTRFGWRADTETELDAQYSFIAIHNRVESMPHRRRRLRPYRSVGKKTP